MERERERRHGPLKREEKKGGDARPEKKDTLSRGGGENVQEVKCFFDSRILAYTNWYP